MQPTKKYKIAIIAPVPFYYHVPLYQKLARSLDIDLMIYYCSNETLRSIDVKKTYRAKGSFVAREDLLKGYRYKFLRNYAPIPSYLRWPFGLVNFGIWQEIKREQYDAVVLQSWTNLSWWLAFFACLWYKTPVLFMTDSNVLSESTKSNFKKRLKKLVLGDFLFKNADGFLTSGITNEEFYKYYGVSQEKMVRLPFSWGYEDFFQKAQQLEAKRGQLRQDFGIGKEDFLILFVGRLAAEKNLGTLLEAFSNVKNNNKKLFFVGDGPLRKDVERFIASLQLKNIEIKGFQSRDLILSFYAVADALVLPSCAETWGIVINEAMCFGLPVISSDRVGAAVDLVLHGRNGFIFPVEDVNALCRCIENLMNLSPGQQQLFKQNSLNIITDWMRTTDPCQQMVKILDTIHSHKKVSASS